MEKTQKAEKTVKMQKLGKQREAEGKKQRKQCSDKDGIGNKNT